MNQAVLPSVSGRELNRRRKPTGSAKPLSATVSWRFGTAYGAHRPGVPFTVDAAVLELTERSPKAFDPNSSHLSTRSAARCQSTSSPRAPKDGS